MGKQITFDMIPEMLGEIMGMIRELNIKVDRVADAGPAPEPAFGAHRPMFMEDLCTLLKKSKATIYRMSSKGEIPCYKQGRNLVFFEDEILDWMTSDRKEYFDRRLFEDYSR